jgi:hypothetical protein
MNYSQNTAFLRWTLCAGADGREYLHAQVEMCELDVIVQLDASGKTWEVAINGHTVTDDWPSAPTAQLMAIAMVIGEIAARCGEPMEPARDDAMTRARAWLEELHHRSLDDCEICASDRTFSAAARFTPLAKPPTKGGA